MTADVISCSPIPFEMQLFHHQRYPSFQACLNLISPIHLSNLCWLRAFSALNSCCWPGDNKRGALLFLSLADSDGISAADDKQETKVKKIPITLWLLEKARSTGWQLQSQCAVLLKTYCNSQCIPSAVKYQLGTRSSRFFSGQCYFSCLKPYLMCWFRRDVQLGQFEQLIWSRTAASQKNTLV